MFKTTITYSIKIDEFEGNFNLTLNTPIEVAEKMALNFITTLGNIKAQAQEKAKAEAEEKEKQEDNKIEEMQA